MSPYHEFRFADESPLVYGFTSLVSGIFQRVSIPERPQRPCSLASTERAARTTWPAEADKQGRSSGLTSDMRATASFLSHVGVSSCYLAVGECRDSWAWRTHRPRSVQCRLELLTARGRVVLGARIMRQRTAGDDIETPQGVVVEGDEQWAIPVNIAQAPKPNKFQQRAKQIPTASRLARSQIGYRPLPPASSPVSASPANHQQKLGHAACHIAPW